MNRDQLIGYAKRAAMCDPQKHEYTRGVVLNAWSPHEWVLNAMQAALAAPSQTAQSRWQEGYEAAVSDVAARYDWMTNAGRGQHVGLPPTLTPNPYVGVEVVDLDQEMWESVKEAAAKSPWLPPEYMMNDWVADVLRFLSEPREETVPVEAYRELVSRVIELGEKLVAKPAAGSANKVRLTRCQAARDGDCTHRLCPQLRDKEPAASGRSCPLIVDEDDF